MFCASLSLRCNTRFGYIFDESKANKFTLPFVLVLLFLTYFLPINDFALPLQDEMYYSNSQLFVHILLLLTLVGGVLSNKLIRPNDYALNLLRMDARRYTVANYLYYLLRVVIGFLPFTLIL